MTNDDLREAIKAILTQLDTETNARFIQVIGREWMWDLLSRAVFLAGPTKPLFADATLQDKNGPVGSIVIVSDRAIVRVAFTKPREDGAEYVHDVLAEAVPHSAIARVSIESVGNGGQDSSAWPRTAQVKLHLDRELAGSDTVLLPERGDAHGTQAEALMAAIGALVER